MGREIYVIGEDWDTCYLQRPEMKERRQQVLDDLISHVNELGDVAIVGDIYPIDVVTHSMAVEIFEVIAISESAVSFEYRGGAD